ncbi:MAG: ribonuclease R [Pseudomonadales bacterium]|nr:ribonuclease R [Pseudomonadales bacterium]
MTDSTSPPNDPFAAREAKKYDHPIASRELIAATLKQADKALSTRQLAKLLAVDAQQFEALQRRLFAMQREGQLLRSARGLFSVPDAEQLIEGKISAHRDGFGFLIPLDKSKHAEDVFLNAREMRKVFDGDIALVNITHTSRQGKLEGDIVQVTTRHTERIVGKLLIDSRQSRVIPDNPKYQHSIIVDTESGLQAEHETLVVVDITRQPDHYRPPKGVITEILGASSEPGMEIEVALRSYDIPHQWPDAVVNEANQLAAEPSAEDIASRIDLRHLPLVTIDGEDARDFDDAVYCEKSSSGGWRLWVAIADVSHYVQLGSALNEEALNRATSVYFPERVIPMLPEAISNGLCSLKPQVDRLCMVCEMTISKAGNLSSYCFYEAVMHSHARLTYTEVGKILAEQGQTDSIIREAYKDLLKPLDQLQTLYRTLKQKREQRGAVNFETTETRFIFNPERKIDSIVPIVRNDAHKLIEECMLLANVATARFLEKQKIPALYRVHEGPNAKKLANLRSFLAEKGLALGGDEEPQPSDYQALLASIQSRDDISVIQTMLLRSMSQAVYQVENQGHFGLAYPAYTHFTSPIRRYPDLLVHRAIRACLYSENTSKSIKRHAATAKKNGQQHYYPYSLEQLVQFGEHCSMAERRADDATRDVSAYLKCEYLSHHLGSHFSGSISAVTSFGFFVELDDLFVEGLVHVSNLGDDFFHFDQATQRLTGERSHQVFQLGDKVAVQVSKVELEDRRVHLLVEQHQTVKSRRTGTKTAAKVRKRAAKSTDYRSEKPADKKSPTPKRRSKKAGAKKTKAKHASKQQRSAGKAPKKRGKR